MSHQGDKFQVRPLDRTNRLLPRERPGIMENGRSTAQAAWSRSQAYWLGNTIFGSFRGDSIASSSGGDMNIPIKNH